jgi:hypothetical protein
MAHAEAVQKICYAIFHFFERDIQNRRGYYVKNVKKTKIDPS